ncbi:MAG: hypothetical protein KAH23_01960 [Kiritimatiellae bacterium]|nr:hypothetical protein [Kiritimatiellia bacterium]
MKAISKGSLAIMLFMFAVSTQMAMGNDIERFFRRTHRSLEKHHKEVLRAHVKTARAVASVAPKVRSVNIRVGSSPRVVRNMVSHVNVPVRRPHTCRMIKVRTWVKGRYENTVERQWVKYWGDCWGDGGGYYEDVVVRRWISGYYRIIWVKDPNCYCKRGHGDQRYKRSHRLARRPSDCHRR